MGSTVQIKRIQNISQVMAPQSLRCQCDSYGEKPQVLKPQGFFYLLIYQEDNWQTLANANLPLKITTSPLEGAILENKKMSINNFFFLNLISYLRYGKNVLVLASKLWEG